MGLSKSYIFQIPYPVDPTLYGWNHRWKEMCKDTQEEKCGAITPNPFNTERAVLAESCQWKEEVELIEVTYELTILYTLQSLG